MSSRLFSASLLLCCLFFSQAQAQSWRVDETNVKYMYELDPLGEIQWCMGTISFTYMTPGGSYPVIVVLIVQDHQENWHFADQLMLPGGIGMRIDALHFESPGNVGLQNFYPCQLLMYSYDPARPSGLGLWRAETNVFYCPKSQ